MVPGMTTPPGRKTVILAVFMTGNIMAALDSTMVAVAVPALGQQFHAGPAGLAGMVIGFTVAAAAAIPVSGWLGDRFGGRRVLLAAIAAFTAASAVCGTAGSLGELTVFRIVQGAAAGLMGPSGMAMVLRAFGPEERARVTAILVVPQAFAPALGPVVGGLFVTGLSWRWAFYVIVPVGAAVFAAGALFLRDGDRHEAGAFDLPGFVFAAAGLAALMYGLARGPSQGWGTPGTAAALAAGVLLLAALVPAELRCSRPLIDVRLLSGRLFRSAAVVVFFTQACYGGVMYLMALFYQYGLGLSALGSGLSIVPEALGVVVSARLMARRLYPALGPRRLVMGGLAGIAAGMAALSLAGPGGGLWLARLALFVMGISAAAVMPPVQTAAFARIGPADIGRASALFNAQRQAAGSIGVAALTTILTLTGRAAGGHAAARLAGYHAAFLTASALALIALAAAATINDADAAATLAPRASESV